MSLRPWSRRVAIIFSPAASIKISDTEEIAPGTRTALLQSMFSRRRLSTMRSSEFVVVVAERAGEADRAAKPGRRNGGIAGLAAAGDQEFRRLHLAAGVGEFVDPHHDILHGAAGAENAGRVCGVSQNGSRPPPRRG